MLEAEIEVCRLRVRIERLRYACLRYQEQRGMGVKFSKLASIKGALEKLDHSIDHESEKLLGQIEAAQTRAQSVFGVTRAKIDERMAGVHGELAQVHAHLDDLERGNGGPTLDGSSEPSATEQASPQSSPEHVVDPQASWAPK